MHEAIVDAATLVTTARRHAASGLALGLVAAVCLGAAPAGAVGCDPAPFAGGTGAVGSPFRIADAAGLQAIGASGCEGSAFVLVADLAVSSPWTPLGSSATPFSGRLDGNGFAITGLSTSGAGAPQGLFGVIRGTAGSEAVVTDLVITAASVSGGAQSGLLAGLAEFATLSAIHATGTVAGASEVGGLVGQLGSSGRGATLERSSSTAAVTASASTVGGLVGLLASGSSITASSASGSVQGASQVGGLVGEAAGGIASGSASGTVTATGGSAGGLAGTSSSTITSSSARGSVSGGGPDVGGLIGSSSGAVSDSSASGAVSALGQQAVGGLVGRFNGSGAIARSFAMGAVTGGSNVGGLVGVLTQSSITDAYATGTVSGATTVGGLVGLADVPSIGGVERAYATGVTSAASGPVGGLIADGRPVTVTSAFWATDSTGQPVSPGGGTASTRAGLASIATFEGWSIAPDIASSVTWGICPAANGGTPFLQWAAPASCAGPGSAPPPVLQQFATQGGQSCAASVPDWLAASHTVDGGWSLSWAQWPRAGRGGPVCTRTLVVDPVTGRWIAA